MRTPLVTFGGTQVVVEKRKVKFTGSTALVRGQAVFYDRDYGTATTADANRDWCVEAASSGNYHNFAGVCIEAHAAKTGGQIVEIFTPPSTCEVYTSETAVTLGDLLYVTSTGYFVKTPAGTGPIVAKALQTVAAAGLVLVQLVEPSRILMPYGTAADLRLPSPAIWQNCPWDQIEAGMVDGFTFKSDCLGNLALANNQTVTKLDEGFVGCTAATAGTTITSIATKPYGVVHLESTTDNEDAIISCLGGLNTAGQCVFESGKQLWMEACISALNITDSKANLFCGFAEEGLVATTTLITASDAMADKDYVGFQRVFADGDKLDTVFNTASGGTSPVTVGADAVTVAADTMIKVGIYCNGTTVYFYSAGTVLANSVALSATDFPDGEEMAFYFGIMLGNGDTFSAEMDWLRIAQVRN